MRKDNLNQEMTKQFTIKLCLLITLFHHVLAQECEHKPVPPANAKVKCTEYAGCRISCKSRYLFPTGEKSIYYQCDPEDGVYKINSDNPEDYDQCKAQCKPPCGNGGICIRPKTCDCPIGWTGNRCQKEITLKPVLTSTPAYDEHLGTTAQLSTEMLETTIHSNKRSSFGTEVTYILNITTQINDEYFGTNTVLPTGYIQTTTNKCEHQPVPPIIANAKVKCSFTDCRIKCKSGFLFPNGEHTVYYKCDPEDGGYKINSDNPEDYEQCKEITLKPVITSTSAYDEHVATTTQLSTEMLETTIHSNERSYFGTEVTYILNITTPISDEYFVTNTVLPTG
ncbi:unnamed protein product, partial [Meganyctiphanes norvegica]